MLTKTDTATFTTDLGTATVEYVGETGSKVWTWTFADGTVATQPNVGAMVAYKFQINAR